jgi:hypothetical protein
MSGEIRTPSEVTSLAELTWVGSFGVGSFELGWGASASGGSFRTNLGGGAWVGELHSTSAREPTWADREVVEPPERM